MPATIPNTFTTNTNIEAAKLKQNLDAVRNYMNGSVVAADIDDASIGDTAIAKGNYIGSDNSHWFETSFIVGNHKGGQSWERTYFTGQTKQIEDYTTTIMSVPINGTGTLLHLEKNATIFIHGYYQMVVPEGSLNGNTVGKDHDVYFIIDSPVPSSYTLAFTEGATASANSGALQGETPNNRRSFPFSYIDTLTAGDHDLYVTVDCNEQQGYISSFSFYVEVFYV